MILTVYQTQRQQGLFEQVGATSIEYNNNNEKFEQGLTFMFKPEAWNKNPKN